MQNLKSRKRRPTQSTLPTPQRRKLEAMAPPPLPDADDYERPQSDTTDEDCELTNLTEMTAEEREAVYKQIFCKTAEILEHLELPAQCEAYPEFADEIYAAYLRYTTFIVKVWVNYDAASGKFYYDKRHEDCAKLVLGPKGRKKLKLMKSDNLELSRVRLEVGNPFNNFFSVTLKAAPSDVGIDRGIEVRIADRGGLNHLLLLRFIRYVGGEVKDRSLPYDQKGMRLHDIEDVAAMFRRCPTREEMQQKRHYYHVSPWMDLNGDDEENDGWVDFKALGKGCTNGCDGCDGINKFRRRY